MRHANGHGKRTTARDTTKSLLKSGVTPGPSRHQRALEVRDAPPPPRPVQPARAARKPTRPKM